MKLSATLSIGSLASVALASRTNVTAVADALDNVKQTLGQIQQIVDSFKIDKDSMAYELATLHELYRELRVDFKTAYNEVGNTTISSHRIARRLASPLLDLQVPIYDVLSSLNDRHSDFEQIHFNRMSVAAVVKTYIQKTQESFDKTAGRIYDVLPPFYQNPVGSFISAVDSKFDYSLNDVYEIHAILHIHYLQRLFEKSNFGLDQQPA